jgi:pimeloyl-ACP methyl ester carboxylesterase
MPPPTCRKVQASYSQNRAADDIRSVLDHLGIDRAHVVGLSMGGFATLHFGFRHAKRALSLCVAGCGYGAEPEQRERFRSEAAAIADFIMSAGMPVFAAKYAYGPTRVQFENKDPRGFAEFQENVGGAFGPRFGEHAAWRSARTPLALTTSWRTCNA